MRSRAIFENGTTSYSFNAIPVSDGTTALTLGTAVSPTFATPGQHPNYTFTLASPSLAVVRQPDKRWQLVLAIDGTNGNRSNPFTWNKSNAIQL